MLVHFREILEHQNITFNDNGTMTYIPRRRVVYIPELSVSDPMKDMVNVPNVPILVRCMLSNLGHLVILNKPRTINFRNVVIAKKIFQTNFLIKNIRIRHKTIF